MVTAILDVALAVLVVIALAALVIALRRHRIARGGVILPAALRSESEPQWRTGQLRLTAARMEWFTLIGLGSKPARSWPRADVELGAAQPASEEVPGIPSALRVRVNDADGCCELALQDSTSKALRAWAESSPPGYNVNVV